RKGKAVVIDSLSFFFWNNSCRRLYALFDRRQQESSTQVYRLLNRVQSACNWDDRSRLQILLIYYDYIPLREKAKREQYLRNILALGRKLNISKVENIEFTFFILHHIMIGQNRSDEGGKMMEEIRSVCGSDSPIFIEISRRLLGYRRAYPSYSPETLKISREKPFPAKYFEDAPYLVAQGVGKKSANYCRSVLWLSQFEYCRLNNDRALQLTNEILMTPGVERMDSYLSAKDLRTQILGEKPPRSDAEVVAAQDSLLELHCLSDIYSQLGKSDAVARVDALRKRVREK
ncbi:MAG: hypothetical protein SGJ27_03330, partial [Candidatus Melainabacteria bacterium]|nr:hypothetical protein [Candidatus Melainabacteria bacterium]